MMHTMLDDGTSILSVCLLDVANIHLNRTRFFGLIVLCRGKVILLKIRIVAFLIV